MVNVDVICVGLMTVQPLATMLGKYSTPTVQGEAKLVPVKVTGTVAPCAPLVGLMEVTVGIPGLTGTVKDTAPLVPPGVVTVTMAAPSAAPPAMQKVAVIAVEVITVRSQGVMPALAALTAQGEAKLV